MGRPFAVMIVTAALIVGGCVSSGEGQRFATSTTGTQPSHASTVLDLVELPASPPQSLPRMLLEVPGWTLVGAGGPPPSPPKDADWVWYVEYDGARISHPDGSWTIPHVVIFGYGDEADEVAASLGVGGYQFDPAPTPGVLVARPGGGVAGVAVITVGDGSVLLLSYDLGSQELATLIPSLVSTPLATWVAATVSEYES